MLLVSQGIVWQHEPSTLIRALATFTLDTDLAAAGRQAGGIRLQGGGGARVHDQALQVVDAAPARGGRLLQPVIQRIRQPAGGITLCTWTRSPTLSHHRFPLRLKELKRPREERKSYLEQYVVYTEREGGEFRKCVLALTEPAADHYRTCYFVQT